MLPDMSGHPALLHKLRSENPSTTSFCLTAKDRGGRSYAGLTAGRLRRKPDLASRRSCFIAGVTASHGVTTVDSGASEWSGRCWTKTATGDARRRTGVVGDPPVPAATMRFVHNSSGC